MTRTADSRRAAEVAALDDIVGLRFWADRTIGLTAEFFTELIGEKHAEDDHFRFMCLCFLNKQIEHMRSILTLGPSRDAVLIVRTMLEGMCQLQWAAEDPQQRAERWRLFAYVHDWRVMQAYPEVAERSDSPEVEFIEEVLEEQGAKFHTKDARRALSEKKELPPDPYTRDWTGMSVWDLWDRIDRADKYKPFYRSYAQWHHWDPGGVGSALQREGNSVTYAATSPLATAGALANGIEALLVTLEVIEKHASLGFAERIEQFGAEYIEWHARAKKEEAPAARVPDSPE